MKRCGFVLFAICSLIVASSAFAQTAPRLDTDKLVYEPGEVITFTGANWEPGEAVTIVMGDDGSEQSTLRAVADSDGAFTVTTTMPTAESKGSVTASSVRKVAPNVALNANYHATANGAISHASAEAEFSEGEAETDGARLLQAEDYWNSRLTYPTGKFDPSWVRQAAKQDKQVPRGVPKGKKKGHNSTRNIAVSSVDGGVFALSLNATNFTALGPRPERMTGCNGCFDYTTTAGRINAIVVDPTTTANGSIVAYAASVGGGVWKTTNCCSSSTTWAATTDDALVSTTSIDTLAIDPNDHNTIYAGTGDLNYGSFSMGSQGILKSIDGGGHWTVLAPDIFGAVYAEAAGQFPQYAAVGKVRVDPNNSNRVAAGTKQGLFFSYDGGSTWVGPCATNGFASQRQDITGLELTNMGGGVTRVLAAIGTRGFATPVQYDLDQNGANGIYSATMGPSGCPSFTSIASNSNGFIFGTAVTGSPYTTGANMNAGSGNGWVSTASGNQLGRIDIGVAPSNPNVIYAQVGSIALNNNSGCGNAKGCQLGVWVTTNGGTSWSFMTGSAGGSLRQCANSGVLSGAAGTGDYPQNWYDQAVAVDPNNADRIYISTFDVWMATRTGTAFYDTTCGYSGVSPKPVHVDQHALAFVPGSSGILLLGNDGGVHGTTNAGVAANDSARPAWFNMDGGLNTIEYYAGDISANFANSASPQAAGGAQDNMDSFITFSGSPTGPAQWQGNIGGDGFVARIDGKGGYFYASNNNGALHRCTTNCSGTGGVFGGDIRSATMRSDRQSFVEPFDLFKGNPGGTGSAECGTRCNHIIVGTYRVWENVGADTGTTWTARSADLTKNTLADRSYINNLHYAPATSTLAIVATNDGNVHIGYGLGGASTFVNLTGGNAVLPNRPMLDAAFDPRSDNSIANPIVGYAAVGGFNANTPSTPGHVFRVTCNVNCGSSTWDDRTGNLPDVPVDSIVVNPNFPQQVFAGTDFGLYYTDDINAISPLWSRFNDGLPNTMVWGMSIDRGSTTLSLWTRSRGAYVWPLPSGPEDPLPTVLTVSASPGTYGGTVSLTATLTSGGNPVPTKQIDFSVNDVPAGSAVTQSNGTATLTASLAGLNAATYADGVKASFAADDAIYAAATGSGSLTVNPLAITVSAVADTKIYDRTTTSTVLPSIAPALIGSDTSGFTQTFDTRNAGTGKTLIPAGAANDGNSGNNYSVTFVNNTNGSISQKPITGSITASNKVYDGNTSATIATRALSGVLSPDVVSYAGGSATFADKTFGNAKSVTATGLTLAGSDSDNYSVNSVATASADITQRPLTITATGISKPYDGNTTATVTLSDNRVAGDVFTDSYASASFADSAAGSNKPVTVTGISISGPDAPNYTFNTAAATTASIGRITLTVTANNASRLYSYANPPFSASYSGFTGSDTFASSVTGAPSLTTTATQSSSPGVYTITAALGTLASNNYDFAFVNGTLTVYLSGFVGLDSAFIGSTKAVADSFDSAAGYAASAGSNALILSNGAIEISGAKIGGSIVSANGSVLIGPNSQVSGNVTAGATITNQGTVGGTLTPSQPSGHINANAVPDCGAFTANPAITGGRFTYTNGDLSVASNSTVTLGNGTYCLHSLTISGNGSLQVSGPVVIDVTGAFNASGGSLVNTTHVPANLQIASSYAGPNGVNVSGGTNAYLTVYAPATNVTVTGGSPVFGALLGKTLTISGNSQAHYDVLLPDIWAAFGF
jgi:hypothetical protein